MDESRRKVVLPVLALSVLAAALYWIYLHMEWVPVERDAGFRLEAQRNPYLAAERFLRQRGAVVTAVSDARILDRLPQAPATLIITREQNHLNAQRWQALWLWLEGGGRLITTAHHFTDPDTGQSQDELLWRLGARLYPAAPAPDMDGDASASRNWLQHAGAFDPAACPGQDHLVPVPLAGEDEPLQIAVQPGQLLEDTAGAAIASAGNKDGIQFIQYRVGKGTVTVLTDISLWSNGKIGCHDHAYLLWSLTGGGSVWLLYHADMPSLAALLWRAAPLPLLLGALLLPMWLWRRGRRFGPMLAPVARQRRRLMEHLRAASLHHWRRGHHDELVRQLRQSIVQAMRHRAPGGAAAHDAGLIARLTQQREDDVRWALACERCADRDTFLRLIQILQSIRNAL